MNQIFRRIKRIIKSNLSDNNVDFMQNEDDELRKIIDSLNNEGKSKKESESRTYTPPAASDPKVVNAYKTLGLREGASVDDIKSAYKNLIKRYHPDRVSGLSQSEQTVAYKKAQEINQAYAILEKHMNF